MHRWCVGLRHGVHGLRHTSRPNNNVSSNEHQTWNCHRARVFAHRCVGVLRSHCSTHQATRSNTAVTQPYPKGPRLPTCVSSAREHHERRGYADDRCGGLGFQQLQMARDCRSRYVARVNMLACRFSSVALWTATLLGDNHILSTALRSVHF